MSPFFCSWGLKLERWVSLGLKLTWNIFPGKPPRPLHHDAEMKDVGKIEKKLIHLMKLTTLVRNRLHECCLVQTYNRIFFWFDLPLQSYYNETTPKMLPWKNPSHVKNPQNFWKNKECSEHKIYEFLTKIVHFLLWIFSTLVLIGSTRNNDHFSFWYFIANFFSKSLPSPTTLCHHKIIFILKKYWFDGLFFSKNKIYSRWKNAKEFYTGRHSQKNVKKIFMAIESRNISRHKMRFPGLRWYDS